MAQEVGPLLGGNPDGPRPGVGSAGFTHVRSGVFFVYHHGRRIDPGREIASSPYHLIALNERSGLADTGPVSALRLSTGGGSRKSLLSRKVSLSDLAAEIDGSKRRANFSSAIRLLCSSFIRSEHGKRDTPLHHRRKTLVSLRRPPLRTDMRRVEVFPARLAIPAGSS